MHSDSEASATVLLAVSSSNLIFICCNYPQESCFISFHTVEAATCVTKLAGSTTSRICETTQCSAHPCVTMAATS